MNRQTLTMANAHKRCIKKTFEPTHQPGSIELFVENKEEAEQSKRSELQHIDNATIPKSRK